LKNIGLKRKKYLLSTLHRPYNVDLAENLGDILTAFIEIDEQIIFVVHPRTQEKIKSLDNSLQSQLISSKVHLIDPVGYLNMLLLEQNARLILTDSGGMQKEAYFFGIPCITLRSETEWVETVEAGWNVVVGSDRSTIVQKVRTVQPPPHTARDLFGDGHASRIVVKKLENFL